MAPQRQATLAPERAGPHDADDVEPERLHAPGLVDFGAVRVPVPDAGTIALEPAENGRMQAVHISLPEGRLSVSALAAPKSSRLWPDLAKEIDASLREGGARVRSYQGEWGRELHATSGAATSVFVGVDGARWMLYGVATGPTRDAEPLLEELRRLVRGTIVVRGRSPYPVRTVLPLEAPAGPGDPDPAVPASTIVVRAVQPAAVEDRPPARGWDSAAAPTELRVPSVAQRPPTGPGAAPDQGGPRPASDDAARRGARSAPWPAAGSAGRRGRAPEHPGAADDRRAAGPFDRPEAPGAGRGRAPDLGPPRPASGHPADLGRPGPRHQVPGPAPLPAGGRPAPGSHVTGPQAAGPQAAGPYRGRPPLSRPLLSGPQAGPPKVTGPPAARPPAAAPQPARPAAPGTPAVLRRGRHAAAEPAYEPGFAAPRPPGHVAPDPAGPYGPSGTDGTVTEPLRAVRPAGRHRRRD